MNIQSGRMRTVEYRPGSGGSSMGRRVAAFVKLFFVLALIGGLANAYIFLNQKITETARESRKVKNEIRLVNRELETLMNRRATFTAWPHIRASIAKYNLKLHPAESGQVRKLTLIAPGVAPHVSVAARTAPVPTASPAPLRTASRNLERGAGRP